MNLVSMRIGSDQGYPEMAANNPASIAPINVPALISVRRQGW